MDETNSTELSAYVALAARNIAREGHCVLCEVRSVECRDRVERTAERIRSLVWEAIERHQEQLPTIE